MIIFALKESIKEKRKRKSKYFETPKEKYFYNGKPLIYDCDLDGKTHSEK
jgi:hypothetical protein